MNPQMIETTALAFTTLAAGPVGIAATGALLCVVPLAAAYWLLSRAARRQQVPDVAAASANVAGSLRHELLGNYDLLRRVGEATPLAVDAWHRHRDRLSGLSPRVGRQVAQAYQAIGVSNRLLAAAVSYDARGQLAVRQRRLNLWPTLEAAVRGALESLGADVPPALQARIRLVATVPAAERPAEPAVAPVARPFTLAAAPRLALFHGAGDAPQVSAPPAAARRPARHPKKARRPARECDGQMGLWGSVVA